MKYLNIKLFSFSLLFFFHYSALANLDAAKLKQLKSAAVYITVESGESNQSGSGFLIHKNKNTGLIVTNAHVVDLNINNQKLHVFFNSGTQKENKLPAKIISLNYADDLAFLEITSDKLPDVIALGDKTEVIETQELYMVGFPFGAKFATNRENPTVTISKGIISSKKLDINDQILLIQIDGDINPGNSGGPIVNKKGELVGVSVATVIKTNIGFAIPKIKVSNMLKGSIGNIQITGEGKNFQLIADKLDPFNKISSVELSIHEIEDENTTKYLDDKFIWQAIENPILNSKLSIDKDTITGTINDLATNEKEYIGQIKIVHDKSISYQSPFRIKKDSLALSVFGPNVLKKEDINLLIESDNKLETTQGKENKKVVNKSIKSIFLNSGIDAYIKTMTGKPEDLFESLEEEKDEKKKEFIQRFVEIFRKDWNEKEVNTHFTNTFKENIDISDIQKLDNLFSDSEFRNLNITVNDFNDINTYELNKFAKEYKKNSNITEEKLKIIDEIKRIRKIEDLMLSSYEVTNRSVLTAMNDILPKSMKKDKKFINEEVKKLSGPYKRYWGNIVYYYMVKTYQDMEEKDLEDYLKLIKTDAFNTFIVQENKALESLLSNHMLTVEEEVIALMDENHKESLGIKMLPDLKGKSKGEIITILIDTHGKDAVIQMLINKSGGEVTTEYNGRLKTSFGRPRKDLVTNASILHDLKNIQVSPVYFAQQVEEKIVEQRHQELSTKRWQYVPGYK